MQFTPYVSVSHVTDMSVVLVLFILRWTNNNNHNPHRWCSASDVFDYVLQVDNSKYSFANEQGFRPPVAEPAGAVADESSGSEGFCDQEPRGAGAELHEGENVERDSDWSDEGIKVSRPVIITNSSASPYHLNALVLVFFT